MTTSDELACRELVELVTEYLEGALSDSERTRFEQHLAGCTGCRRYLSQMRQTIKTLGHLREEDLSPEARNDLLSLFRNWENG